MEKMVEMNTLTPSGRDFLIACLDPMHDTQLPELRGWPDVNTSASLIVCIKQSTQIAIPTGSTGNWTCIVNTNPMISHAQTTTYQRQDDLFLLATAPAVTHEMSAVVVSSYAGAAAAGPFGLTVQPTAQEYISLPSAYTKGKGRLVGMGFEVNNTTAELYKQGTVTVYRQTQQDVSPVVRRYRTIDAAQQSVAFSSQEVVFQPTTLSDAMLLSGTRQWEARDGCYVVSAFTDAENLVLPAQYVQPALYSAISDDIANVTNTFTVGITKPDNLGGDLGGGMSWHARKWAPIHSGGAMFTGLSEQTTLTLTVHMYYEAFPTAAEPEYCVLARPSSEYDPVALQMLTRAMENMPVGVRAADNGLGDWFAGLVSEFAVPIGSALGTLIPGAQAMGSGAKWLADRYITSNGASLAAPKRAGKKAPAVAKKKQASKAGTKANPHVIPVKNIPKWWAGPRKAGTRLIHEGKHYVLR